MTERPLSIATQIATPAQTASNSTTSTTDAPPIIESADEEPYTIKCICDYSDDDGNTIYCETCDTWQHIECFYPGRVADASRAEFDHSCADCKPRPLDRRHATERQRQQRHNKLINDTGDKKTKRPPSKSHKKKSKPTEVQTNGYHEHDGHRNGSPQEHHMHSKKIKGHRSTHSISTQSKRSPPLHGRSQSVVHPPSPAHTPPDLLNNFQLHGYSDNFLSLYDQDQVQPSSTNSYASLAVSNAMTSWVREPERLQSDVGVTKKDVFQNLTVDVETLAFPELRVERKEEPYEDTTAHWRLLITPVQLGENAVIGELNGLIGLQRDYCNDVDNRWHEAPHPRPFVFFHPVLPLFIDTRREGSLSRYVRRSCRANTSLDTILAGEDEYHFWLTSERALKANEEVTIPWSFRFASSRFNKYLNDDDATSFDGADITEEEYESVLQGINIALSDHGGCACGQRNDCAFARFYRHYHARSQHSNGLKSKKGNRKTKQNHTSPTSTGHATNSRAASESHPEQIDEEDNRSVSGSIRSKPHSRDLTPSNGVAEVNGITTEPSERDKRKLAMVEDTFRKLEQGQPPRKKKRASDGSNVGVTQSIPSHPAPKPRQKSIVPRTSISQPSSTNGSRGRQYVDASTSRRQSGSPFSAVSPTGIIPSPRNDESRSGSIQYRSRQTSSTPKATYADSSTQTEDVDHAWWKEPKPRRKRSIIPLAKRLLNNRYKIQAQQDVASAQSLANNGSAEERWQPSPTSSMDIDVSIHEDQIQPDSPTLSLTRKASISSWSPSIEVQPSSIDAAMPDAPLVVIQSSIKPPPPPWPGQQHYQNGVSENTLHQKSDLRVQMPPNPLMSTTILSTTPSGSITPSSATGSLAQSPFGPAHLTAPFSPAILNGIGHQASPIKTTKKLSLGEYNKLAALKKKADASATKGTSPTLIHTVLKTPLSAVDEVKVLEDATLADSPAVEKEGLHLVVDAEQQKT